MSCDTDIVRYFESRRINQYRSPGERDERNDLLVENNCFKCDGGDHREVYHVTELPSSAAEDYAISTEFPPAQPGGPVQNVILLSSYNSDSRRFDDESTFNVPYLYYGSMHGTVDTRTWVTSVQDFRYGSEFNDSLCYTTTHNGGILVWDPDVDVNDDRIVSRISVSQCGGWDYEVGSVDIGGELGDVHRAVVLEGGSDSFSDLDSIQIDNRLLFYSNNTMGLMICDISKPDAPQHIWQWDCDTRPCEESSQGGDWDWHGAGNMDDDTIDQAEPGSYAARTFGIGVAYFVPEESPPPPTIHVYLAGGIDGLRLLNFSEFLNPFGVNMDGESNFDDFSIDIYDSYIVDEEEMQAFDLQTFSEDGDTYVFTSWKMSTQYGVEGPIGLTVHLDEDVVCD